MSRFASYAQRVLFTRFLRVNPGLVVSGPRGEQSTTYGPGWASCSACRWSVELSAQVGETYRAFSAHACEDHRL